VNRDVGAFDYSGAFPPPPPVTPGGTRERLDYDELSLTAGVNQLLGASWSVGSAYKFTRAKLHDDFSELAAFDPAADMHTQGDLQQATIYALYNHHSGFFGRIESQWYHQENSGYAQPLPGDDFFMHNVFVGYRLRRQRGEISFGVLNLAGTDYRLNPLNTYAEMARERVYVGRFRVNF
jgi:hypothetical protein